MNNSSQFWILDGYGMFFQSFYAVPELKTSFGQPINAVYGMLNSILRIINKFKPEYICVALDTGGKTFRDDIYSEMNLKIFCRDIVRELGSLVMHKNYNLSQKIINNECSEEDIIAVKNLLGIQQMAAEKIQKIQNFFGDLNLSALEWLALNLIEIKKDDDKVAALEKLYKGNRKETPVDLKSQFAIMEEMLNSMNIKHFSLQNYEADDIIAFFANDIANNLKMEVNIASNDKDLSQLLSDKVKIYNFKKKDFITKQNFIDEYKFEPRYFADFLALTGDSIDNVPGVKGIGKKTAGDLICEHKTVENILENLVLLKNAKSRDLIKANTQELLYSKQMTLLKNDLGIDFKLEDFKFSIKENLKNFNSFSKKYEFGSVPRR